MGRTLYRDHVLYREPGLPYNGRTTDPGGPPPSSVSYFLPPIESSAKPPPWPRVPEIPNRSEAYRHFYANQVGRDVTVAGITYRGGYWNGPLTTVEVAAITAAGYGARIRSIPPESLELLPAGIDGPLP